MKLRIGSLRRLIKEEMSPDTVLFYRLDIEESEAGGPGDALPGEQTSPDFVCDNVIDDDYIEEWWVGRLVDVVIVAGRRIVPGWYVTMVCSGHTPLIVSGPHNGRPSAIANARTQPRTSILTGASKSMGSVRW